MPRTEASGRSRPSGRASGTAVQQDTVPSHSKPQHKLLVQSSLKAHSKMVQGHPEVHAGSHAFQGSCLIMAILAEASQRGLTLLCPPLVNVRASVATERVQLLQACTTLVSDTFPVEGGWAVWFSLPQWAVPERQGPSPSPPTLCMVLTLKPIFAGGGNCLKRENSGTSLVVSG